MRTYTLRLSKHFPKTGQDLPGCWNLAVTISHSGMEHTTCEWLHFLLVVGKADFRIAHIKIHINANEIILSARKMSLNIHFIIFMSLSH